jgi:hypothetical protein
MPIRVIFRVNFLASDFGELNGENGLRVKAVLDEIKNLN